MQFWWNICFEFKKYWRNWREEQLSIVLTLNIDFYHCPTDWEDNEDLFAYEDSQVQNTTVVKSIYLT